MWKLISVVTLTSIFPWVLFEPNVTLRAYYMANYALCAYIFWCWGVFLLQTRRLVSDSGIVIAMFIMAVLDYSLEDKVITEHVSIDNPLTEGFNPTQHPKRGWFINPGGMNKSMSMGWIFAAIIPAFFVGILLFMETEMAGVLLSKKEHKLAKGPGYNLDMFVVGILTFGCSLLGLPWMCADTVRSASHANALSIYSTSHAPGEKPHIIEVKEQRISNIIIHILTGERYHSVYFHCLTCFTSFSKRPLSTNWKFLLYGRLPFNFCS